MVDVEMNWICFKIQTNTKPPCSVPSKAMPQNLQHVGFISADVFHLKTAVTFLFSTVRMFCIEEWTRTHNSVSSVFLSHWKQYVSLKKPKQFSLNKSNKCSLFKYKNCLVILMKGANNSGRHSKHWRELCNCLCYTGTLLWPWFQSHALGII